MSSRRTSPFGGLGERVGRTEASEGAGAPGPAVARGGQGGGERPLPCGQHLEVWDAARGWVPGLLAAWERRWDGQWWGRVVVVADGEASELLIAARMLRPPEVGDRAGSTAP